MINHRYLVSDEYIDSYLCSLTPIAMAGMALAGAAGMALGGHSGGGTPSPTPPPAPTPVAPTAMAPEGVPQGNSRPQTYVGASSVPAQRQVGTKTLLGQ